MCNFLNMSNNLRPILDEDLRQKLKKEPSVIHDDDEQKSLWFDFEELRAQSKSNPGNPDIQDEDCPSVLMVLLGLLSGDALMVFAGAVIEALPGSDSNSSLTSTPVPT